MGELETYLGNVDVPEKVRCYVRGKEGNRVQYLVLSQDEDGRKTKWHLVAVNEAVKCWQNCSVWLKNSS